MKTSSHDHIQGILKERGSPLQKIFAMYEAHQNLDRSFLQDLPEQYKNQVKLLLYKGGVMTLGVPNSAIYSRINYIKQELLDQFKSKPHWAGLREIKVKISI